MFVCKAACDNAIAPAISYGVCSTGIIIPVVYTSNLFAELRCCGFYKDSLLVFFVCIKKLRTNAERSDRPTYLELKQEMVGHQSRTRAIGSHTGALTLAGRKAEIPS